MCAHLASAALGMWQPPRRQAVQAGQSRVGKASSALVGSRQPQGDPGKRQSPNFFLQAVGTSAQRTGLQNGLWGAEPAALPPAGEKPCRVLSERCSLRSPAGFGRVPFLSCRCTMHVPFTTALSAQHLPVCPVRCRFASFPPGIASPGLGSQDVVPGPSLAPLCSSSCRVARSLRQEQRHT